jgi:hypothetical protein
MSFSLSIKRFIVFTSDIPPVVTAVEAAYKNHLTWKKLRESLETPITSIRKSLTSGSAILTDIKLLNVQYALMDKKIQTLKKNIKKEYKLNEFNP